MIAAEYGITVKKLIEEIISTKGTDPLTRRYVFTSLTTFTANILTSGSFTLTVGWRFPFRRESSRNREGEERPAPRRGHDRTRSKPRTPGRLSWTVLA